MQYLGKHTRSTDLVTKEYVDAVSSVNLRLRVLTDRAMYLDSSIDLGSASIKLGRLKRRLKKITLDDGTVIRKKKHGWGTVSPTSQYNVENIVRVRYFQELSLSQTTQAIDSETAELYPFRYIIQLHTTDSQVQPLTALTLTECFGFINENGLWVVPNGHQTRRIYSNGQAGQTYAIVVNGKYLPFKVFQMGVVSEGDAATVLCKMGMTPL